MANNNKDKQQEILEFIKKEIATRGYPPSVREICEAVGLRSTSTVHGHLERLEKKGLIRRNPSKPRAIELVNSSTIKEVINVPIVGNVAAGQPILAIENIEDSFPLPSDFIKINNNAFILKVKGDSMIEKGIYDGDYLIVEQQSTANNGDIVVALVDDSATVKTFYKENGYIRLQPENSSMQPIIVKDCKILGKVKGLIRKY
ncbi:MULTISPECIES: transcriptional repressor LexA [Caloramator]|jgi:repressor LexA|uniref:LexA repressor n=1 Tax=Caloramator australicus RC3 TaxID=857293 RepID=I7J5K3_9CLOT|nr:MULTISPECIES: transcriptional repressor LexA [Caloramator]MDO6355444.1 transcriptional repressor LexA [Caloramator sp. CAR-1]CCJ33827.1 SOS-response repressor and protease LexA [Caloramator australicus RC3]